MIVDQLGGLTASVVGYALDGLMLRHDAIAMNIANVNTQGYRPVEVNFEKYLSQFLKVGDAPMSLPQPLIQPATSALALRNSVEMQTVGLNQNVLQYQALITGMNKYMSMVSMAVADGRK